MWSEIFINSGTLISEKRNNFFEETKQTFFRFAKNLKDKRVLEIINSLEILFHKGWASQHSLKEVLELNRDSDQRKTSTTSGPHRADIKFLIKDSDIKYILSRGEQKFYVNFCGAFLCTKPCQMSTELNLFLIIDDIHSELDEDFYNELINFLPKTGNQLFFQTLTTHLIVNKGSIKGA